MSQGHRIPLKPARSLAARIVKGLRPACQSIKVAGSVRRHRPDVGDIELVVIPKYQPGLFPDVPGQSLLDLILLDWVESGRLLKANNGSTLRKFYIPHLYEQGQLFKLEINVSTAERWPVEMAIKTGPAEFSHRLVMRRDQGGLLPSDCVIENGWQVRRIEGGPLEFYSERDFVVFCCGRWVRPEDRD